MHVNLNSLFVTGVGGFIGLRLAERAIARGMAVSGMDASAAGVERARLAGVDAHVGDVTDAARLAEIMRPVSAVVHTAAIVREYGALETFRAVNVGGSVNVARTARSLGIPTFVQLSSVMVYGFEYPPDAREHDALRGEGNPYCQTKIESEAAVLALNEPSRFGVIVIRPGDVYGPGSVPWIVRPIQMMKKRLLFLPAGGQGLINHVYVDDLVDGIFLAIEKQAYGEAFNLTGGKASTSLDFFGKVAARAGVPRPRALPTPILKAAARVISHLRERGLTDDEASVDTIRYLMRMNTYSISKARARLGYAPQISLEEGLARTQSFINGVST